MTEFAQGGIGLSNRLSYKSPHGCSANIFWRDLLLALFPEKTAFYAASYTRTSVRAVEHVLRGRNSFSGSALVNLLRSPVGPRVLDALVADVDWRAAERRLIEIESLRRELARLEQKRSDLDRDLSRNQ